MLQFVRLWLATGCPRQHIGPTLNGQAFHEKAESKSLLVSSPTYRRIHLFPVFFFDCLTLEDGTDMLSRNVVNRLPTYNWQNPRRSKTKIQNNMKNRSRTARCRQRICKKFWLTNIEWWNYMGGRGISVRIILKQIVEKLIVEMCTELNCLMMEPNSVYLLSYWQRR